MVPKAHKHTKRKVVTKVQESSKPLLDRNSLYTLKLECLLVPLLNNERLNPESIITAVNFRIKRTVSFIKAPLSDHKKLPKRKGHTVA